MAYINTRTRLLPPRKGLKLDKSSIYNLFEKASAEAGLGMTAEAKTDLQSVVSLTEKNRNTAERASIYAKIAALTAGSNTGPMHNPIFSLPLAWIQNNADLYILQGDIYTSSGNYSNAIDSYNKAIAMQGNQARAWQAKVEAMVKMNQAKYGTSDANTLASKMNSSEKKNLCDAIQSGISQGMKNMNIDLLRVAICK